MSHGTIVVSHFLGFNLSYSYAYGAPQVPSTDSRLRAYSGILQGHIQSRIPHSAARIHIVLLPLFRGFPTPHTGSTAVHCRLGVLTLFPALYLGSCIVAPQNRPSFRPYLPYDHYVVISCCSPLTLCCLAIPAYQP